MNVNLMFDINYKEINNILNILNEEIKLNKKSLLIDFNNLYFKVNDEFARYYDVVSKIGYSYSEAKYGEQCGTNITLMSALFSKNNVKKLHTYLHEFRHVLQYNVVKNQGNAREEELKKIREFEENLKNYYKTKSDVEPFMIYYLQFIEIDANDYAINCIKNFLEIKDSKDFIEAKSIMNELQDIREAYHQNALGLLGEDYIYKINSLRKKRSE